MKAPPTFRTKAKSVSSASDASSFADVRAQDFLANVHDGNDQESVFEWQCMSLA